MNDTSKRFRAALKSELASKSMQGRIKACGALTIVFFIIGYYKESSLLQTLGYVLLLAFAVAMSAVLGAYGRLDSPSDKD